MKKLKDKIVDIKRSQLYKERKFYELSQEILDLSNAVDNAQNEIMLTMNKIQLVAHKMATILGKRTRYSKSNIISEVTSMLQKGEVVDTLLISNQYGVSRKEAWYILKKAKDN